MRDFPNYLDRAKHHFPPLLWPRRISSGGKKAEPARHVLTGTIYAIARDAAWVMAVYMNAENESKLKSNLRDCAFKSENGGEKWYSIDVGFQEINLKLESLVIDPRNPSTLYAGTRRGVFKSVDFGATWPPKNHWLKELHIKSIAVDADNGDTVYAGTIVGAFKTTDGGDNWTYMGNGLNKSEILSLTINPDNTDLVYAGTANGLFKSTDGGSSWSEINNGQLNRPVKAVVIDPVNSNVLYVATSDGIYKTTDGGNNWIASWDNFAISQK